MTRRLLLTLIAALLLILAMLPSHVGAWTHCDDPDPRKREADCKGVPSTAKPVVTTTAPVTTTTTKPPVIPTAVVVTPKGLTG